jgi:hypothetical protein
MYALYLSLATSTTVGYGDLRPLTDVGECDCILHTYIHTYIHILHTYIHTCMHAYTYIHSAGKMLTLIYAAATVRVFAYITSCAAKLIHSDCDTIDGMHKDLFGVTPTVIRYALGREDAFTADHHGRIKGEKAKKKGKGKDSKKSKKKSSNTKSGQTRNRGSEDDDGDVYERGGVHVADASVVRSNERRLGDTFTKKEPPVKEPRSKLRGGNQMSRKGGSKTSVTEDSESYKIYVAHANRFRLMVKVVILIVIAAAVVMHLHGLGELDAVYFVLMTLTTGACMYV